METIVPKNTLTESGLSEIDILFLISKGKIAIIDNNKYKVYTEKLCDLAVGKCRYELQNLKQWVALCDLASYKYVKLANNVCGSDNKKMFFKLFACTCWLNDWKNAIYCLSVLLKDLENYWDKNLSSTIKFCLFLMSYIETITDIYVVDESLKISPEDIDGLSSGTLGDNFETNITSTRNTARKIAFCGSFILAREDLYKLIPLITAKLATCPGPLISKQLIQIKTTIQLEGLLLRQAGKVYGRRKKDILLAVNEKDYAKALAFVDSSNEQRNLNYDEKMWQLLLQNIINMTQGQIPEVTADIPEDYRSRIELYNQTDSKTQKKMEKDIFYLSIRTGEYDTAFNICESWYSEADEEKRSKKQDDLYYILLSIARELKKKVSRIKF